MNKYYLFGLLLMLSTITTFAQNPDWMLAPKFYNSQGYLISLPNPPSGYNNEVAATASNMQLDAQGNIQFFVVGAMVFNGNGDVIGTLWNSDHDCAATGESEIVIMPDPNTCTRYYIFASGKEMGSDPLSNPGNNNHYPYYAVIDVSTNTLVEDANGNTAFFMLDMIPNGISVFQNNSPRVSGVTFAASKLITSYNSRFVFVSNNFDQIFRFKVTSTGVTYDGVIPMLPNGSNYGSYRSEMELVSLSNGHYRIATMIEYVTSDIEEDSKVFTAELNSQGNVISQHMIVFSRSASANYSLRIKGLEFTSDGGKLFIAHTPGSIHSNPIEYYDFAASQLSVPNIPLSEALDFQWSQIETGSGGLLYFVTSNRLASYNPATNVWNNNAKTFGSFAYRPNNGVNDIDPNSTDMEKLYTLPDQIDGMDYYAHFLANLACCIANETYSASTYTATTSATWQPGSNPFNNTSGTVLIRDSLIIPANKSITIKNMVFKFAPDAKVIISRAIGGVGGFMSSGGKLTLDNTLFSVDDRCSENALWLGVQVYGYNASSQTSSQFVPIKQGTLIMVNNSTIEKAKYGVEVAKLNPLSFLGNIIYLPDLNFTGGIVQATNSNFKNNLNDVLFWDYIATNNANNVSFLTNCNFQTTNVLNDMGYKPQYHVYLQNVTGISLKGNDFSNTAATLYTPSYRGYGIYSNNAKYNIDANCTSTTYPCSSFDPNVFQNLYYGVYATSVSVTRTIHADRNQFVNNIYGMYLNGQNYSTVTRNNFEIFRAKAPNPIVQTAGLYLWNSTGYQVEGNTFTEYNDPNVSGIGNSVGVLVRNSGEVDNIIYRNTFSNLNVGGQSQDINGPAIPQSGWNSSLHGLKWKCNTFTGNMQTADLLVASGRIDYQQGYLFSPTVDPIQATQSPAGNKSSHSSNNTENDIKVNSAAQQFQYIHHSDYITQPANYTTSKVSPYMNYNVFYPVAFNSNSCPSNLESGAVGQIQQMTTKVDSLDALISDLEIQAQNNQEQSISNVNTVNSEASSKLILANELGYLKAKRSFLINEKIRSIIADTTINNSVELVNNLLSSENITLPSTQLPVANLSEQQLSEVAVLKYFLAPITAGFAIPLIENAELATSTTSDSKNRSVDTNNYLSIYPNPTTSGINTTVSLQNVSSEDYSLYSIEVFDLSLYGRLWVRQTFSSKQSSLDIPNNQLEVGLYVVKLFHNGQLIETKMLQVN